MALNSNFHKEIKKMVDGLKITYSRLKRLDSGFLEMTTVSEKKNEQQTIPSLVKLYTQQMEGDLSFSA